MREVRHSFDAVVCAVTAAAMVLAAGRATPEGQTPPTNSATLFADEFERDTMSAWEVIDLGAASAPSRWFIAEGAVHQTSNIVWESMPAEVGVSAHRGDNRVAPENTLPAIRLAVEKGPHRIEIDLRRSKDGQLIILHDDTLDRTTDGTGRAEGRTFAELRWLDAGRRKGDEWAGTRIPTFREVLEIVPPGIQLNCHLRPGVARQAVAEIAQVGRFGQCFLARGRADAEAARQADPRIRLCNMQGQGPPNTDYPAQTIAMKTEYLQLLGWHDSMPTVCADLREHGVQINYCCTSDPIMFRRLLEAGVQYRLTDNLKAMIPVLRELGVPMARP